MKHQDNTELLSLKQLAKRWGFHVKYTRRKVIDEGILPFVRLGEQRGIRVRLVDVLNYEESRLIMP